MESWRRVEVAACEELPGCSARATVPRQAELEAIRAATFTVAAVNERERTTDHDVAAFVDVLAQSAGAAGRWIHFGLTSSDVLDTALALQLRAAGEVVVPGARRAGGRAGGARARARGDAVRRPHARRARRADDVRRQARGLRVRGAPQRAAAASALSRRRPWARSRARSAPTRRPRPSSRRACWRGWGWSASRSPRRSSRATVTPSCCRRSRSRAPAWSAWRRRCATCSARRCARCRSRFAPARRARARCRTSAIRSRASRSPASRASCAAMRRPPLENVALWHERDISHSSVERVILPDSTILIDYLQHRATALVTGMTVDVERMRENLELTYGALFSQRVLLALVETGMARDAAYYGVQRAAQQAWDERHAAARAFAGRPDRGGAGSGGDLRLRALCALRAGDRRAARRDRLSDATRWNASGPLALPSRVRADSVFKASTSP